MYTNINLGNENNQFMYVIEYSTIQDTSSLLNYSTNDKNINFGEDSLVRKGNNWYNNSYHFKNEYIPEKYTLGKIRVYLPAYSIETYANDHSYILSLNTWIDNIGLCLGNFCFKRSDVVACDRIKTFYNKKYYECVEFYIPDPWDIIYSERWRPFRRNICGVKTVGNFTGSLLNISLHPVIQNKDSYELSTLFYGGQNALKLSDKESDLFALKLTTNTKQSIKSGYPSFICNIDFNESYNGNLYKYVQEMYNISDFVMTYGFVIGNEKEIICSLDSNIISNKFPSTYKFDKTLIQKTLQRWTPGLFAVASLDIKNKDGDSIIYIISNKIPFTEDLYSYFSGEDFISKDQIINNINLNNVDMYSYNINAVNKIEQKIVKLQTPEDSKKNIVSPVFYSVKDLHDLVIHPEVVENICINLDQYKSKVDYFILQLEGCNFNEIGRTSNGVIFKIIGNKLPNNKKEGTYYVLNQDYELVSQGKYKYVS